MFLVHIEGEGNLRTEKQEMTLSATLVVLCSRLQWWNRLLKLCDGHLCPSSPVSFSLDSANHRAVLSLPFQRSLHLPWKN